MKPKENFRKRNSTVKGTNIAKLDLKLSNINYLYPKNKFSISPRKKMIKNNLNLYEDFNKINYKNSIEHKHISMKNVNRNKYKFYKPFQMNMPEAQKQLKRKITNEIMGAKTKKFFRMYSLEDKEKIKTQLNNNYNNLNETILNNPISDLENNIKNVLNNIKLKIEKQNNKYSSDIIDSNLFLQNKKKRLSFSHDIKFNYKKKRLNIKNKNTKEIIPFTFISNKKIDLGDSLLGKNNLKRSHSLEFSNLMKKRIYKRMKLKLNFISGL